MFKRKIEKGETCLNCSEALTDANYCPNCGQYNNTKKPTILELFYELISNLFAFDSKFYKSIIPLVSKPGKLTLEFNEGKRLKYMQPLRLFIVVTIILLTVNSIENSFIVNNSSTNNSSPIDSLFSKIDSAEQSNSQIVHLISIIYNSENLSSEQALKKSNLKNNAFNRFLFYEFNKFKELEGEDFRRYIKSKYLIICLLFIPFLALILKLVYIRHNQLFYIDHFTFALHEQTVLFLVYIMGIIIDFVFGITIVAPLSFLIFFIHLYIALKSVYNQSYLITSIKFILVNTIAVIVSLIFVVLSLFTTFLLY